MWSKVHLGKYEEKTLPQILLTDPDYFFWAVETGLFNRSPALAAEAAQLEFNATHIRIPRPDPQNWRIQYIHDHHDKFCGFTIVQLTKQTEAHPPYLDLSIVQQFRKYDKLGNKMLLSDFKQHYFGSKEARLTKKRCEEFFDNGANFVRQAIMVAIKYEPPMREEVLPPGTLDGLF